MGVWRVGEWERSVCVCVWRERECVCVRGERERERERESVVCREIEIKKVCVCG